MPCNHLVQSLLITGNMGQKLPFVSMEAYEEALPASLIRNCPLFRSADARAIGGCVDSPENPTAILALVVTAGALAVKLYYHARR